MKSMKLVIVLLLILGSVGLQKPPKNNNTPIGELPPMVSPLMPIIHPSLVEAKEFVPKVVVPKTIRENVILTNYYVGDGSSGTTTSSGLKIKDFQVNEMGWYTYKGKVVVAAATTLCLRVKSGPCGKYNVLPEGYRIYDLRDHITIVFNGKPYEGIVLDSCGACMTRIRGEEYQRYDIFIKSNRFGKVNGQIEVTIE